VAASPTADSLLRVKHFQRGEIGFPSSALLTLNPYSALIYGADVAKPVSPTAGGWLRYHVCAGGRTKMSNEAEAFTAEETTEESNTMRMIAWLSVGVAVAALGIYVGYEARSRYKFKHRTPYDFYSNAGKRQPNEFGMGI
jgi:hypothetical protein